MAMTFLGLPDNILSEPYVIWDVFGFTPPTDLEPAKLGTEEPSEVARIPTLSPEATSWYFYLGGLEKSLDGFALVNHNLSPGSLVRFIGNDDQSAPFSQPPNAIAASSNITGGVTNVDEAVDSPDGLQIVPTNPILAWNARFQWPALLATPRLGDNMGYVVVRVKLNVSSGTLILTYPKLTADLYESGVLVETLGYRAVSSQAANGQIFIFPFNFSDLSSPSGANIECKVTCDPGTTEAGITLYGTLDTLSLGYEDNALSLPFDSGYIEIPEPGAKNAPTKSVHGIFSTHWTGVVRGVIRILSDQSVHNPTLQVLGPFGISAGLITSPATYIDVGVAVASEKVELGTGIQSEGPQINVDIEEIVGSTLGGQTYGADSFRRRICEPTQIVVNRAEKDILMDYIAWRRGRSGAFYIILESGVSLVRQVFTSFWGTLKSIGTPRQISTWHPGDEVKYNMSIAFEEKL